MAGIGFALKKITEKDNLSGVIQGYLYATLIATGPWLMTVACLVCINIFGREYLSFEKLSTFRIIVIYNFCFSLVFSGPVVLIVTRYLADLIYQKDVESAGNLLIGAVSVVIMLQLPLVSWFYLYYVQIPDLIRLIAFANYFLVSTLWLVMVFLTAIKSFRIISFAFIVGLIISFVLSVYFSSKDSVAYMLLGFSLGIAFIVFVLMAYIFAEYRLVVTNPFYFLRYFKRYWEVALSGFMYNLCIWVDKWVMWFSDGREELVPGMVSHPDYDSAMFLSFVSIVPTMAMFLVSMETKFFEKYLDFYQGISDHQSFDKIRANHKAMIKTLLDGGRNILVIQSVVSITVIFLSPRIIEWYNGSFSQIGIFRFGVLGAMFHGFIALILIIFYYFDLRRMSLLITTLFLVLNFILSYVSMSVGFRYYGYGYFLSALITFVVGFFILIYCLKKIPFYTFIKNNASVE